MRKNILSRISIKLILLVAVSFFASLAVMAIIGGTYVQYLIFNFDEVSAGPHIKTYFNIYILVIFILPTIVFISIFLFGINKKIRYVKYISKSLLEINDQAYLKEIKVEGNDEISELVRNINIMSDRLKDNYDREKRMEDAKNDLIVAVSHDLKSPLTSIIGYLDLLKNEKFQYDEEQKSYLNIAYNKSLSLKNLILELFEYTKIANGYVTLEKVRFNIAVLINQILGEHITFFNDKNIQVSLEADSEEMFCRIDIQRMMRVIENIINNAEKYSYPNSTFRIKMMKSSEYIRVIFENTGDNIAKEDIDKIFEKMYRLDKSRTKSEEGSGLGLAIAKKIVELHGGEIWATCECNNIKINMKLKAD